MRSWLAVAVVASWSSAASLAVADPKPDPKVTALADGYQKEAASCAIQAGGVAKVLDGAAKLQADPGGADDQKLTDDVAKLTAGRAVVDGYCTELAGVLDVIAQNPTGTYRSLEHELDARDNKIRRARAASKKTVDALEPVIHGLIPRINARASTPAPDKHTPTKFPSGHDIELPALPGNWRLSGTATTDTADYADKGVTASVWIRAFTSATCDQQRRTLPAADAKDHPTERRVSEPAKQLGVAWSASYVKHTVTPARLIVVACAPSASGGWIMSTEIGPAEPAPTPAFVDDMAALMFRMLAAAEAPAAASAPTTTTPVQ